MGGELTYRWVSGNTYKLTLSVYRDCFGISIDQSYPITISSVNGGVSFSDTLNMTTFYRQHEICSADSTNTTCSGAFLFGYQKYVYTGNVTLPSNESDWKFGMTSCCRNDAITNINLPSTLGFLLETTLNNLNGPNNSPQFSTQPIIIIQRYQTQTLSWNAFDIDGDILEYTLINPLNDSAGVIPFATGYSASQPFDSFLPCEFDSLTGAIKVSPADQQTVVVSMLITEKRLGIVVGSVRRDLQMVVVNNTGVNHPPILTGFNNTNSFNINVLADSLLSFNIYSTDSNLNQQLSITWDSALVQMGAVFTPISSGLHPGVNVSWTPDSNALVRNSVNFTLTVRDDNCPYNSLQVYTYTINILPSTQCLAYFTLYPDNTTPHNWLALNQAMGASPMSYLWSWGDGDTSSGVAPSHTYTTPGNYNICLSIIDGNSCTATYCDSSTYVYKTESNMISVNVVSELPSEVNELINYRIVSVYPNPLSSENWQLLVDEKVIGKQVQIFDVSGRTIYSSPILNRKSEIDGLQFSRGVYFLKIENSAIKLIKL